jgi:hypothetical protein
MKLFSSILIALSIVCFGCTDSKNAAGNTNAKSGSNGENTAKTEAANADVASRDAKLNNVADSFLELPEPKPVEKAKKQSYTGITINVPADWKALTKFDSGTSSGISFHSPGGNEFEALKVTVGRSYEQTAGDMQTVFLKEAQEKARSKIMLRGINGTTGLLSADTKDDANSDYLRWEVFLPPDAKGYTVRRFILFNFPNGTYEQNKQLMTDILFSSKVEN